MLESIQSKAREQVKISEDSKKESDEIPQLMQSQHMEDFNLLMDQDLDLVGIIKRNKQFENENLQLKQHIYELKKELSKS